MPLFKDATPPRPRPAEQQAAGPPPSAPDPPAAPPNAPPPVAAEVTAIRRALEQSACPPGDRERVARMAVGLLPPTREAISVYGRAALDDATRVAASVEALGVRAAALGVDDFLAQITHAMQPQIDGRFQWFWHPKEPPLNLTEVDHRLRDILAVVTRFRSDLATMGPGLPGVVSRLERHGFALAAIAAVFKQTPSIADAARARRAMIESAASGAAVSIALYYRVDEQARLRIEAIERMLYVSLPNWRVLHGSRGD